ncbi:uncharacterized protein LOC108667606, partial [Hyalella azteca]|uniref:Uncharacterized protein LOC108667606 n=1 Tax=Hyalella azteca TaxID=294128 RepID=A0A8B7N9M4_HYAAZ
MAAALPPANDEDEWSDVSGDDSFGSNKAYVPDGSPSSSSCDSDCEVEQRPRKNVHDPTSTTPETAKQSKQKGTKSGTSSKEPSQEPDQEQSKDPSQDSSLPGKEDGDEEMSEDANPIGGVKAYSRTRGKKKDGCSWACMIPVCESMSLPKHMRRHYEKAHGFSEEASVGMNRLHRRVDNIHKIKETAPTLNVRQIVRRVKEITDSSAVEVSIDKRQGDSSPSSLDISVANHSDESSLSSVMEVTVAASSGPVLENRQEESSSSLDISFDNPSENSASSIDVTVDEDRMAAAVQDNNSSEAARGPDSPSMSSYSYEDEPPCSARDLSNARKLMHKKTRPSAEGGPKETLHNKVEELK